MSSDLDINHLLTALDNEDNESIINLTTRKIQKTKNDMLQQLQLPRQDLKTLHKKLKYYRYVDELPDLNYGCYIRWIPLKDPEHIRLTNGGIICEIKILKNGIHVVCKNNMHRLMQLKFDECFIFQKLTDQERVLLNVMDHLEK